jgi:hypothetical protein
MPRLRETKLVSALLLSTSAYLAACNPYDAAPAAALEGHLRAYVVDYADGTSRIGYALEDAEGVYTELEPAPELAVHVGTRVRIEGRSVPEGRHAREDDVRAGSRRVLVQSLVSIEPTPGRNVQAITDGAPRTIRVAAILLNFQGVTPQRATKASVEGYLSTVRAYYQELSYGIWNIEFQAFGPFEVARPTDCELDRIGNLARNAASNAGVSLTAFDHVAVTLPSNGDSGLDCACGVAWMGRAPALRDPGVQRTSYYTCVESNAFAHELGHAFGLHHASTGHCNGVAYRRGMHETCSVEEYGNRFNTMGNGLGHMNAFQKSAMKWLDRCNNVRVTRNAVYDLAPIQVASNGIQSLQIPTGDTHDGNPLFYYVEYRNPASGTFNAMDGNTQRERGAGVHIDVAQGFVEGDGDGRPVLLDLSTGTPGAFTDPRLTAGRSFVDPDNRVTVTVVETNATRARIEVSFPNGGLGTNTCSDGTLPPGSTVPSNTALTLFQHCNYDGWSVALEPGDYTSAQLSALGVPDNDASSLNLKAGYEAILYDGPDLTGTAVTLTASSGCLVSSGFNDRVSSIRIRAIATGGMDGGVPMDAGAMDAGAMDASTPGNVVDASMPGGGVDAGDEDDGRRFGSCVVSTHTRDTASQATHLVIALTVLGALYARRRRR